MVTQNACHNLARLAHGPVPLRLENDVEKKGIRPKVQLRSDSSCKSSPGADATRLAVPYCNDPSGGAKNTRAVKSSMMSKKRCSTFFSTKITLPCPIFCSSEPARNDARPLTT